MKKPKGQVNKVLLQESDVAVGVMDLDKKLSQRSKDGWELVTVSPYETQEVYGRAKITTYTLFYRKHQ